MKQILTSVSLTLCLICLAVVITLNFRPLYYFDIGYFNLVERTGYTEEIIRENYDVLIDYNSVFYKFFFVWLKIDDCLYLSSDCL